MCFGRFFGGIWDSRGGEIPTPGDSWKPGITNTGRFIVISIDNIERYITIIGCIGSMGMLWNCQKYYTDQFDSYIFNISSRCSFTHKRAVPGEFLPIHSHVVLCASLSLAMQVRQAPAILSIRNGVNWDNSGGACLQMNIFVYAMSIDVGSFSETMPVTTCRFFSNSRYPIIEGHVCVHCSKYAIHDMKTEKYL